MLHHHCNNNNNSGLIDNDNFSIATETSHNNDDRTPQRRYGFDVFRRRIHDRTALEKPILNPDAVGFNETSDPVKSGKVFKGIYTNPYTNRSYRIYEDDVSDDLKMYTKNHEIVPQANENHEADEKTPFIYHNPRLVWLQGGYDRRMPRPLKDDGTYDIDPETAYMPDYRNPYMQRQQSEALREYVNKKVQRESFFSNRDDEYAKQPINDNFPTGYFGRTPARRVIPYMPATQRSTYDPNKRHVGPGSRDEHEAPNNIDELIGVDFHLMQEERNARFGEHTSAAQYPDGNVDLQQVYPGNEIQRQNRERYAFGENTRGGRKTGDIVLSSEDRSIAALYDTGASASFASALIANKDEDPYVQEIIRDSIRKELVDDEEKSLYLRRNLPEWQTENAAATVAQQQNFLLRDADMRNRIKIMSDQQIPASLFEGHGLDAKPNAISAMDILARASDEDRPEKYDFFLRTDADVARYVSKYNKDDNLFNMNFVIDEYQNLNEKTRKLFYDQEMPGLTANQNIALPFGANTTESEMVLAARFLNTEDLLRKMESYTSGDEFRFVNIEKSRFDKDLSEHMFKQYAQSAKNIRDNELHKLDFEKNVEQYRNQNVTAFETLGSILNNEEYHGKGNLNRDLARVDGYYLSDRYAVPHGSGREGMRRTTDAQEKAFYDEIFTQRKDSGGFMSRELEDNMVPTVVYPTAQAVAAESSMKPIFDSNENKSRDHWS